MPPQRQSRATTLAGTTRSRKTLKELKGDDDIPSRAPAGRINMDLTQLNIAHQRFEGKREQAPPVIAPPTISYAEYLPNPDVSEQQEESKFTFGKAQGAAKDTIKEQIADYIINRTTSEASQFIVRLTDKWTATYYPHRNNR
ncbi:hypothetical protein O1611_g4161 [Lasiodiplodia mahajangana]|uniref:Uncharacterized protein n=1 Tax=Lasiodiplodia mahajangana TaxID=1108764 RepID=A0ACC2JPR1_9PEZI|nr:hypothetical protein O1611_g4161 [Lasiodiplodia mahajangana]